MNAVDTNVLVYARDPREPRKQRAAIDLLNSLDDGALLWQVACEYLSASRKLAAAPQAFDNALEDLNDLRMVWTFLLPAWTTLEQAHGLVSMCSISFWDAMIVAACLNSQIDTLYSEDIQPHPAFGALKILNPFA